jgi:glycosyltransferase involved in cell wall biosynthesis
LQSELRYRFQYPIEYRLGLMKAWYSDKFDKLSANGGIIRFLIISDGASYTSEQQFAPLRRYAASLRRDLGVVFRYMRLSDAMRLDRATLSRFHAVGLKLFFRNQTPGSIAAKFREQISGTGVKLVYFDGDDDACVQWPELLRSVDHYVKKGVFACEDDYLRSFVGKTNLTDYVWREYGVAPAPQDIPSSDALDRTDLHKLHLGWSIALDDRIAELIEKGNPTPVSDKVVDILCRANVPKDWSFSLRNAVIPALEPLKTRYRVLQSTERVSLDQYYQEMRRARICVSPLGYGEVCWRDFEAIACGCLLVKPDMSHLRSYPNLFVPGETYVPVRWDYADLAETCVRYLESEAERTRIADNAFSLLTESHRDEAFVSRFADLLERLQATSRSPRLAQSS